MDMSIKTVALALVASFNLSAAPPPEQQPNQAPTEMTAPTPHLNEEQQKRRDVFYHCADATLNCWTAEEKEAAIVMEARMILVVGALQCAREHHPDEIKAYNDFNKTHSTHILAFQTVAINHFVNQTPEDVRLANREYDRFLTRAVNLYSEATNTNPSFCPAVLSEMAQMRSVNTADEMVKFSYRLTQHPKP
jgi:hypothetical protein